MILLAISLFVLRILIGFLILDLIWVTPTWRMFFLKAFLSIGIGLGISSLEYFFHLVLFDGGTSFLYFELLILLTLIIARYKKGGFSLTPQREKLSLLQIIILFAAGTVFITSLLGLVNYVFHRQVGDWDSWMIFNRAARFIYRGQEFWQDAFSDELDVVFHADYPPMLAMNIASSWEVLGKESIYTSMFQSLLFSIACVLSMAFALYNLKSISQAGLGIILLWGSYLFVYEGGRQTADIPLAFFMLASVIFHSLFKQEDNPILIALAGFCAGLAAWTKNEGSLFVLASAAGILFLSFREHSMRRLQLFVMGLALPIGATLYFKLFLSPSSEFLRGNITAQLTDISRHKIIFASFFNAILGFGPEKLGNYFLLLILVYLIIQLPKNKPPISQYMYILIILAIQFSGYYLFYLISPYDLVWHTRYSSTRLIAHLYPLFIFLVLYISRTPEELFASNSD